MQQNLTKQVVLKTNWKSASFPVSIQFVYYFYWNKKLVIWNETFVDFLFSDVVLPFVPSFILSKYIKMVYIGIIRFEGHCYPPISNMKQCRDNCSNIRRYCITVIRVFILYLSLCRWYSKVHKLHSCYILLLWLINNSKDTDVSIKYKPQDCLWLHFIIFSHLFL